MPLAFAIFVGMLIQMFRLSNINNRSGGSNEKWIMAVMVSTSIRIVNWCMAEISASAPRAHF